MICFWKVKSAVFPTCFFKSPQLYCCCSDVIDNHFELVIKPIIFSSKQSPLIKVEEKEREKERKKKKKVRKKELKQKERRKKKVYQLVNQLYYEKKKRFF